MNEPKCDFCEKEAVAFGRIGTYQACSDHIQKGEDIEAEIFDDLENLNND